MPLLVLGNIILARTLHSSFKGQTFDIQDFMRKYNIKHILIGSITFYGFEIHRGMITQERHLPGSPSWSDHLDCVAVQSIAFSFTLLLNRIILLFHSLCRELIVLSGNQSTLNRGFPDDYCIFTFYIALDKVTFVTNWGSMSDEFTFSSCGHGIFEHTLV